MTNPRPRPDRLASPRSSVSVGPICVLWLDLWTNRYGVDVEVTVGRRIYWVAAGFGVGFRSGRGVA